MISDFTPYGAQYYRTPNPPSTDWKRDLREMKARGMNTVRLWAMWSWIHTSANEYDFSELDALMDLCNEIGLKALIQVILENAPSWLVLEHPEAKYVANDGQQIWPMGRPNTPGGGWPGLCLDNGPARDAAGSFMTALATHFADHPALLGYDVWNEVWFELDGYIGGQYYCYCPGTVEEFKTYLGDKYGDLESLGKAWYRRYSSWNEVYPPRYWGGYPDWLDFIEFRLANQGRLLKWRVDTLRAADPNALLVSHGLPTMLGSMANHLTDDWRNAAEVDVYGLSCFPHWFNYDNIETVKVHDMIRSACSGKTFWTAETQAGASGEGLMHSKIPSPEDIRLWNWISLACGAKGVLYWQWRPELLGPESPGFGLCALDGSPTERTTAASWFARFSQANPNIHEYRPIRGQIAIAVLPESQIFCHVSDKNAGKYAQSVRGIYKALTQAGYQVDFAKIDQIDHYELVYLPFPLMMKKGTAQRFVSYVKGGGMLISEACPGQFGDGGYVQTRTPGYGLHMVFGAHAKNGPETVTDNPPRFAWGSSEIGCCVHQQRLSVDTAKIIAAFSDGSPAVIENTFGAGKAILVATYPGICSEWGWQEAGPFIADMAAHMGITPRATAPDPDILIRLHKYDNDYIAYIVNLAPDAREVSVRFSEDIGPITGSVDVVSGESMTTEDGAISMNVDGYNARVMRLRARNTSCLAPTGINPHNSK